ncbi:MAG TPA: CmpA/NrtA family ABC transporter substrate-binding protein [Caulobacteraceae bacterium]|nr:CmpA/NrtA family ABC transporter substrate-binding protein [Caulobacteraceae bacterium]
MSLEKTRLELGFIPLTDCAPLAAAQVLGFFEAEGLDVKLTAQASWANVRDRVAAGLLDGAHMLGPMTIAQSLGIGGEPTAMAAPLALNLNGSAITVSTAVAEALRELDPLAMAARPPSSAPLARLAGIRRAAGAPPLTFAVVFPYSIHNYALRDWLAAGGAAPDRDVRLTVIPPARMVEKLAAGDIDGFCVGAPWNTLAAARGVGEILVRARDWWGATPDKVLGFTRDWAGRHPETLLAVLRATMRGAAWADAPENRATLAAILSRPEFVAVSERVLLRALEAGDGDGIVFSRYAAGFPWRSHAAWFLSQMTRWRQAPAEADVEAAMAVYRPDLFREAAAALGEPAPTVDAKLEGAHDAPWTLTEATAPIPMPADRFLTGEPFDWAKLMATTPGT